MRLRGHGTQLSSHSVQLSAPHPDFYCIHVCRRDQTLLHSFPRVLSPDYIQTQYVLFFDFPRAPLTERSSEGKAGARLKIADV